jgi:outer membrane lipoprotein-sorting protein
MYTLLITICFLLLTPVPSFSSAGPDQVPLHSIQADFVQEKHLKILRQPIISTGIFAFQAPRSLRWEYITPIPSILLMHNGKMSKFIKTGGRFTEEKGIGIDAMQLMLGEISNWLEGRFSDNEMFTASFPDAKTIILTPRGQATGGLISKIELTLGERKGVLDTVTIFEGPDSYTRMTFSHAVINGNIPASMFTGK